MASDLVVNSLKMSHKKDTRLKWINMKFKGPQLINRWQCFQIVLYRVNFRFTERCFESTKI